MIDILAEYFTARPRSKRTLEVSENAEAAEEDDDDDDADQEGQMIDDDGYGNPSAVLREEKLAAVLGGTPPPSAPGGPWSPGVAPPAVDSPKQPELKTLDDVSAELQKLEPLEQNMTKLCLPA